MHTRELVDAGRPNADEPPDLLHEFFTRSAALHPDRIAVDVPPGRGRPERRITTYRELLRDTEHLAAHLAAHAQGERIVGVLLPRDTHLLYAAQLAILSVGGAHLCLDPGFPDQHLRDVFADAGAVAVLTDAAGVERIVGALPTLDVAAMLATPADRGTSSAPFGPDRLAYVIYTSGTTGRPKGVAVEHRSIARLIAGDRDAFEMTPDDRVAQGSSPAYDSALEETWLAFAAGAAVVVMDADAARLGPDLVRWLRDERITVLCPTPTLLRTTVCADPARELPELRLIYAGGEALPQDLADRWSNGRTFVNGYGPTECTVTALRGPVRPGEPVTIGTPVPGNTAWLLDERLEPVADGAVGELCIGGVGLARGYLDRPALTAERFIAHPRLGRLYRTGDLARRRPDGAFEYLGRLDAQVKLRGHRVELQEIEARLLACPGVLAAACRLQGEPGAELLAAFVVPADPAAPPDLTALRASLAAQVPAHMVPTRFAVVAALPTTVGGKLDRRALPELPPPPSGDGTNPATTSVDPHAPSPRARDTGKLATDPVLSRILTEFARSLGRDPGEIATDADFFDLGGDSVRVAVLVSRLRDDPATAGLAVRDVYEARTVAALATRARSARGDREDTGHARVGAAPRTVERRRPAVRIATLVQSAWLLLGLVAGSTVLYALAIIVLPFVVGALGTNGTLFALPALGLVAALAWVPCALAIAVLAKRLLIGRYIERRAPVFGAFWLRHWTVQRLARGLPWGLLQGTELQNAALRALGARIGRRVHLHRGVDLLSGGWDLLELGNDVTVARDATLGLCELDDGHLLVAPIRIGSGATVDVRAGVAGGATLGEDAFLGALSSLPHGAFVPSGERWDGVPATRSGRAPATPRPTSGERAWSPLTHALAVVGFRLLIGYVTALPFAVLAILALTAFAIDTAVALAWLSAPSLSAPALLGASAIAVAALPLRLLAKGLLLRLSPPVAAGTWPRLGPTALRIDLRTRMLEGAGVWLSGSLFWPWWLRLAGMRVGRDVEISTILDVLPEQVTIDRESFFADGIYLGGPVHHRGTVTVAPTAFGRETFLGNHVVVPAGTTLPPRLLLGVCTVADAAHMREDSSWFGHPPFELPRREVVSVDRRLTHEPGAVRYVTRLLWEAARFVLPAAPLALLALWYVGLDALAVRLGGGAAAWLLAAPMVTFATGLCAVLAVVLLKWLLLGRVRPGQHPLWSCWCSRWDFLYVAWGFLARAPLARLGGTLWLGFCLRATGMRIGRRVVLGPGFAQVVDPDMLTLEDDATVDTMFQAHSFEDRVLKIDRVRIGRRCSVRRASVLLYGADLGDGCHVAPHSVVMKNERLLPDRRYEGVPTRPVPPTH